MSSALGPTRGLLVLLLLLAVAGCQRAPLDEKIEARNEFGFSLWLSKVQRRLTPDEARELKDAVQQLRYAAMDEIPGAPKKELEERVFGKIYGLTARELLLLRLDLQRARIDEETRNFETVHRGFSSRLQDGLSDEDLRKLTHSIGQIEQRLGENREKMRLLDDRKIQLLGR